MGDFSLTSPTSPTLAQTNAPNTLLNSNWTEGNTTSGTGLLKAAISAAQSDSTVLAKIAGLGSSESLKLSDGTSIQSINSCGKLGPKLKFTVVDATGKVQSVVIEYNRKTGKLELPSSFASTQATSSTSGSLLTGSALKVVRLQIGQLFDKNAKRGSVIGILQNGIGAISFSRSNLQKLDTEKRYQIKFENGFTACNSGMVGMVGPIIEFKVEHNDGRVYIVGVELNRSTGKLELPSGFSKIKFRDPGAEYLPAPGKVIPNTNGATAVNLPW